MVAAGFNFLLQSKLYIWKRRTKEPNEDTLKTTEISKQTQMLQNAARLGGNKLRDLAWSLDVLDLNKHQNTGS